MSVGDYFCNRSQSTISLPHNLHNQRNGILFYATYSLKLSPFPPRLQHRLDRNLYCWDFHGIKTTTRKSQQQNIFSAQKESLYRPNNLLLHAIYISHQLPTKPTMAIFQFYHSEPSHRPQKLPIKIILFSHMNFFSPNIVNSHTFVDGRNRPSVN
jgi:hypothetical protein